MEQTVGCVFQGWLEGSINFAPTYKYAMNSDQYSAFIENKAGHKRRIPAWYTNRIFLAFKILILTY